MKLKIHHYISVGFIITKQTFLKAVDNALFTCRICAALFRIRPSVGENILAIRKNAINTGSFGDEIRLIGLLSN